MEIGNVTRASNFKNSPHESYKKTQLLFYAMIFNYFMRQTLTDDFLGVTQK